MKELKLALLGFGNAGRAFGKLLLEKHDEIKTKYDTDVKVVAIATGSRGNLVCNEGIDVAAAIADIEKDGKFAPERGLSSLTTMEIVETVDYDVMAEMTPLNIFTGQPATDHIKGAFARKKHAITANKGPIAWHFRRLADMAKEAGVCFFYETTVMDGTPVFNLVEHTLKFARVTEVSGILNSTTNFILEEMEKGCDYDDIMERGRALGFVEADPAMDIEGYDAAAKITALLNVLMDAGITPDMVERKGIEDITYEDIENARAQGKIIKLVCKGTRDADGNVHASVQPTLVDRTDLLATVNSTTSIVSITTDLMKKITVVEHDPEIEQTAYGVFGDLIRVLDKLA
ncbi:MAG: homoserine dehydrogenase [Firmicutes bacterium]|nr:homoserine dehydrogenase [Bacillota bacterium]